MNAEIIQHQSLFDVKKREIEHNDQSLKGDAAPLSSYKYARHPAAAPSTANFHHDPKQTFTQKKRFPSAPGKRSIRHWDGDINRIPAPANDSHPHDDALVVPTHNSTHNNHATAFNFLQYLAPFGSHNDDTNEMVVGAPIEMIPIRRRVRFDMERNISHAHSAPDYFNEDMWYTRADKRRFVHEMFVDMERLRLAERGSGFPTLQMRLQRVWCCLRGPNGRDLLSFSMMEGHPIRELSFSMEGHHHNELYNCVGMEKYYDSVVMGELMTYRARLVQGVVVDHPQGVVVDHRMCYDWVALRRISRKYSKLPSAFARVTAMALKMALDDDDDDDDDDDECFSV